MIIQKLGLIGKQTQCTIVKRFYHDLPIEAAFKTLATVYNNGCLLQQSIQYITIHVSMACCGRHVTVKYNDKRRINHRDTGLCSMLLLTHFHAENGGEKKAGQVISFAKSHLFVYTLED